MPVLQIIPPRTPLTTLDDAGNGIVTREWWRFFESLFTVTSSGGSTVPPGMMGDFAGPTPPSGWLLCDGSAISRTNFSALFVAIGTTWGAGDGSTTFNVPNFKVGGQQYVMVFHVLKANGQIVPVYSANGIRCIKT